MKIKKIVSMFLLTNILISQLNVSLALSLDNNDRNVNNNPSNDIYDEYLDNKIYSDVVNEKLSESLKFLNLYKENNEIINLDKSISEFTDIPYLIDINELEYFKDGDVFDFIFYEIRDEVYAIKDKDLKSSKIIYLGEKLFLGWRKFKMVDIYGSKYLVKDLVEYNRGRVLNVQDRLDYLKGLYLYYLEAPDYGYEDDEIPEIDLNEDFLPPAIAPPEIGDIIEDEDTTNNDNSNSNSNNNSNNNLDNNLDNNLNNNGSNNNGSSGENEKLEDSFVSTGKFTEYENKNNKCYEVLYTYKNGVVANKIETLLPKSEYVKCGIYTYVHDNISQLKPEVVIDRDYIENNQNIFSKNSVYYTTNKDSKHPYYYNTFIPTSLEDNSLTYNELKDVIYNLSIIGEGYSILDNDKQLIILEGKPLVLKSEKDKYTKKEIESILDKYSKYGLKIMESSSNKCYTLESSVLNGELTSVLIDNNEIELLSSPKLIENTLFMSVNEIAPYLGANISLNSKGVRVSKGNTNINLLANNNIYYVNKQEKSFYVSPILIDGELYVDINRILQELEYKMTWDSDVGKLFIEKNSLD